MRGDTAALLGKPACRIAGRGIAADRERTGHTALVGRTVTGAEDLAELAQVYRDPPVETFRVFFVKGSTIVHATGASSRSVAKTGVMPAGVSKQDHYARMKAMMASTGADSYTCCTTIPQATPNPAPPTSA